MPQATVERVVAAPPDVVWRYLSDVSRLPEWMVYVHEVTAAASDPGGDETTYSWRGKPGPKVGVYEWEIQAWDPPRRQVHVHRSGEFELEMVIELDPAGAGTRWRHSLTYRLLPAFRPLGWLLERTTAPHKMRADLQASVDAAKERIEAVPSSG